MDAKAKMNQDGAQKGEGITDAQTKLIMEMDRMLKERQGEGALEDG